MPDRRCRHCDEPITRDGRCEWMHEGDLAYCHDNNEEVGDRIQRAEPALTTDERDTIRHYIETRDRYDKLTEAEDRTFERYMNGTGSAATARKARSRTNALSDQMVTAEARVFSVMDRYPGTEHGDIARFLEEIGDEA